MHSSFKSDWKRLGLLLTYRRIKVRVAPQLELVMFIKFDNKYYLKMKKLVLISLLAILTLFLAGCGETVYKETKQFSGDKVEFDFTLSPESPTYYITVSVDYDCSNKRENVNAVITSPSGKTYSSSTHIGQMSQNDCALKNILSFSIKDVQQEDGNFKLTVTKEGDRNKINDITLKVKK